MNELLNWLLIGSAIAALLVMEAVIVTIGLWLVIELIRTVGHD